MCVFQVCFNIAVMCVHVFLVHVLTSIIRTDMNCLHTADLSLNSMALSSERASWRLS